MNSPLLDPVLGAHNASAYYYIMCKCGIYKQTLPKALGDVNERQGSRSAAVPRPKQQAQGKKASLQHIVLAWASPLL